MKIKCPVLIQLWFGIDTGYFYRLQFKEFVFIVKQTRGILDGKPL